MSTRRKLAILLVSAAIVPFGCDDSPDPIDEVDAGTNSDGGPTSFTTPTGMTSSVWTTIQSISPPGGLGVAEDPTNAFVGDPAAIRLGQFLFYEEAISSTGDISCASCHEPDKGFADGLPLATAGAGGEANPTGRHTPGLLNTAYSQWYFWDGRADTLWGQAAGPLENPIEMDGSRVQLAHYVNDNPEVKAAYEELFGALPDAALFARLPDRGHPVANPQSPAEEADQAAWDAMTSDDQAAVNLILANTMKAISAFEHELISFNSPFDVYVDQLREFPDDPEKWDAISDDAKEGVRLFVDVVGCAKCHAGPLLLDDEFHNIGLPDREWADSYDIGRWDGLPQAKASILSSAGEYSDDPEGNQARLLSGLPQREKDKGSFRTPTLRNVALTPPYMHAGQFETLQEVLEFYNDQPEGFPLVGARDSDVRGLKLEERQIHSLVAFLEALDGEPVPDEFNSKPASPLID